MTSDTTIDPQWRAIIHAALELNDPCVAELVTRAEAGDDIVDTFESMQTTEAHKDDSTLEKIEALAEIVCRAGDEPTAALFILMERLKALRIRKYSQAEQSMSLLVAAESCTCTNWLTLKLQRLKVSC